MFLRSLYTVVTATSTFSVPALENTCPPIHHLRLENDQTFQISVFEDLHYGEAEDALWGPQQDINSTRVMNAVLDTEVQQLVVLNGDLITGENTHLKNSSLYLDEVVQPMVQRRLVWASTYGNHDSDFNLSRNAIFAREKIYSGSLTQCMVDGDSAGISNYYIPVYAENGATSTSPVDPPALLLWFFDSRRGNHYQQTDSQGHSISLPNWVDQSVVDWFTTTRDSMTSERGRVVPSIAFVHIPITAMLAFQDERKVDANRTPGVNDDVPLDAQGYTDDQGTATEGFAYAGQDHPFMEALVGTEGLMGVFSGHDHGDTWCQKWNTTIPGTNVTGNGRLNLCFGQHSGYGGYGSWIRGSRQIHLDFSPSSSSLSPLSSSSSAKKTISLPKLETWIRLEDGSESGRVVLNSTYGSEMDRYPAVRNRDSYGEDI
ncbi:hypothetical protein AAFC00_004377 [Neodothiora populina]|uniref:Calcineurin-like phosphoesterase domain-containing protein n=1 Tax=Neodothiora populina TaxID=2781224 RepID=A0ABR3PJR7_9PEZI